MQFHPPIPLPQRLPKILHKIRSPKYNSPEIYMDDMVSPQWNVLKLFMIYSTRNPIQDSSQSPTQQILCVQRFYQSRHSFILPCIMEIRYSGIYSPKQSTDKFSSNDRHHYKFQNSHLQPTLRRYSPEATQLRWPQSKTCYNTTFSRPSVTSFPFTGPFAMPLQDHEQPIAPFQDRKCKSFPLHKTILPQLMLRT